MATVFERNGGWYIYFRWQGKRYRELAGTNILKSDAEQFLAKRMREVQKENIYDKKPEAVTFVEFADSYLATACAGKKSKDRDDSIVEMFKAHWQGRNLTDITAKMVEDFRAKRLLTRAAATVLKELRVLKRLYRKGIRWGRAVVNPVDDLEMPIVRNNRVRHLGPTEINRLMKAVPDWLRPRATFARFTAARLQDTFLRWYDVDMKQERITFRNGKNGEDATIPMNNTVRRLLEALPRPIDQNLPVFGPEWSAAVKMRIFRAWRDACETAKIQDFHFHDLRHQCATDLIEQGATLYDVQGYLRHKSTAMTARYAHLTDDRREKTARLLDRVGRSPKTATGTSDRP